MHYNYIYVRTYIAYMCIPICIHMNIYMQVSAAEQRVAIPLALGQSDASAGK